MAYFATESEQMTKNNNKSTESGPYWHCFACGEAVKAGIRDEVVSITIHGVSIDLYTCSEDHAFDIVEFIFGKLEEEYCDEV